MTSMNLHPDDDACLNVMYKYSVCILVRVRDLCIF